jgi:UMF1 family MFS transporter
MVGWVGVVTGNPRIGILSLLVLFLLGAALLMRVDMSGNSKGGVASGL